MSSIGENQAHVCDEIGLTPVFPSFAPPTFAGIERIEPLEPAHEGECGGFEDNFSEVVFVEGGGDVRENLLHFFLRGTIAELFKLV